MTPALLLLSASLAAAAPDEAARVLRTGNWNERIHAAQSLADDGPAALPLLRVAADDADWQVRMTAVHELGRLGAPAVADLERTLEGEPCRTVRLTALHWLGSIDTDEARAALRRGLQDESGMVRLVGRYYLQKDAGPRGLDPDAAQAESEDLKACLPSAAAGRLVRPTRAAPSPPDEGEIHEAVVTPDPTVARSTPAPAERLDELDALLAGDEKPAGPPGLPQRAAAPGRAEYAAADARGTPRGTVAPPRAPRPAAGTMPPGAPGLPARPAAETAGAGYAADDGKGKAPADPLPALRRLLVDPSPAKRARAADELGKLGPTAAPAAGALAAALKDPDRRVRASAALALGNLGAKGDPAVPALVRALKRGPEEVAWSAAVALGRIGTPRARKAFARYARQSAAALVRSAP